MQCLLRRQRRRLFLRPQHFFRTHRNQIPIHDPVIVSAPPNRPPRKAHQPDDRRQPVPHRHQRQIRPYAALLQPLHAHQQRQQPANQPDTRQPYAAAIVAVGAIAIASSVHGSPSVKIKPACPCVRMWRITVSQRSRFMKSSRSD